MNQPAIAGDEGIGFVAADHRGKGLEQIGGRRFKTHDGGLALDCFLCAGICQPGEFQFDVFDGILRAA